MMISENVVMQLSEEILNTNRTLYTDNYYTSVALPRKLLHKKTHLVGTLRKNRKLNPKSVVEAKLQKGEMISRVGQGICVSKWMDKREVLFSSTKHRPNFQVARHRVRGGKVMEIMKPTAIIDYNSAKTYIDVSDQLKSYADPTRRIVKWYRKLLIELFCNIAMVNSYILYLAAGKTKISITEFREHVTRGLLYANDQAIDLSNDDFSALQKREIIMDSKT